MSVCVCVRYDLIIISQHHPLSEWYSTETGSQGSMMKITIITIITHWSCINDDGDGGGDITLPYVLLLFCLLACQCGLAFENHFSFTHQTTTFDIVSRKKTRKFHNGNLISK